MDILKLGQLIGDQDLRKLLIIHRREPLSKDSDSCSFSVDWPGVYLILDSAH